MVATNIAATSLTIEGIRQAALNVIYLLLTVTSHGQLSAHIAYLSGQDGAIFPTWDYPLCPARKLHKSHINTGNKSFIDQPHFLWTKSHPKKELAQYPSILTSLSVNNPIIYYFIHQVCSGQWFCETVILQSPHETGFSQCCVDIKVNDNHF